ncbi:MAG: PPC domain-containing protein [Armatimonadota bacterium]
MHTRKMSLLLMLLVCTATAWAAGPYAGYVYPAGGQQGTVVRVMIGGQRIGGARGITISGTGVQATFVSYEGAGGPLNAQQRDLLKQRLQELAGKSKPGAQQPKTPPATPANPPANAPTNPTPPFATPANSQPTTPATPATMPVTPPDKPKRQVTLPDLPDLRDLDQKTPKELRKIANKYLNRQKRTKPPIAETVTLDITIAPDAAPGGRELRLQTPVGLSNPLVFQVGQSPEVREKDREDEEAVAPPPADAPVVLNGQIMPGEVDRFALKLKGGQHLVIAADARHLIPYLADAVPGWVQAVLTLYDANGKELAFADDNSFDPDPSLFYQVPQDGDYVLAVRDAIYRGREDFVYRVIIREQTPGETLCPFASLSRMPQDGVSAKVNPQLPWVDSQLPQRDEVEPNNTAKAAQKISLPQLCTGRIAQPGDIDVYQFTGKAGETVVAEVYARRLGSPIDAQLRLSDAAGHVLAWNDDHANGEMGLITHQADSYLTAKLPADGVYFVQVLEGQRHGGDAYNYHVRIGSPHADFALRMTPSCINVPAGGTASITVYAFRKDGWDGDIEVALTDAPEGFTLKGAKIPAGKDHVTVTLEAQRKKVGQPLIMRLEGRAQIDGTTVSRPVVPAERMMQAFAYYHLVPAQQLMVMITRR